MTKAREKSICRLGHLCKIHCKKYPCFNGLDDLSNELAVTCQDYQERSDCVEKESQFYMESRKVFSRLNDESLWNNIDIKEDEPKLYNLIILGVNHKDPEAIFIKKEIDRIKRKLENGRKKEKRLLETS